MERKAKLAKMAKAYRKALGAVGRKTHFVAKDVEINGQWGVSIRPAPMHAIVQPFATENDDRGDAPSVLYSGDQGCLLLGRKDPTVAAAKAAGLRAWGQHRRAGTKFPADNWMRPAN